MRRKRAWRRWLLRWHLDMPLASCHARGCGAAPAACAPLPRASSKQGRADTRARASHRLDEHVCAVADARLVVLKVVVVVRQRTDDAAGRAAGGEPLLLRRV